MKVLIREVTPSPGGDPRVLFDATPGSAGGIWRSAVPPVVGRSYEVEFTLDRIVDLDGNASVSKSGTPSLKLDGDRVTLTSLVEEIDRERIGSVRLAPDAAVTLDLADPRVNPGDWLTVTAGVDECDLYAFGA